MSPLSLSGIKRIIGIGFCVALSATVAQAQFNAKVVDISEQSQSVTVPLNRSVMIETTVKVARVDVGESSIVETRAISPMQLLVTGRGYGRTSIVLFDDQDKQYVLDVSVEVDTSELTKALRDIDPQSTAVARSVFGTIVLTGTVSGADRAERMVQLAELYLPAAGDVGTEPTVQNHMELAGEQQVLVRVIVAEVSRRGIRELGINGFLAGENVGDAFLVNQVGNVNTIPLNIGAAADALANGTIPFLTDTNGIPLTGKPTLSLGFPRLQMQLFIRALTENSLASVLAEPNLVVISGETASFLSGGEFPVPVPQGIQQVTIKFREFGIRLQVTPVVRSHDRIRLRVAPEVSELDFTTAQTIQGLAVPGLTTRLADTTIELNSGQTIAIAGLLSEQVRGIASVVPGIGDLPVLGALFRSVQFQRSMTELVILVTPEIIAPLDANQMVELPTDKVNSPTDFELYMLGMIDGAPKYEGQADTNAVPDNIVQMGSQPDELSIHGPWGHALLANSQ